MRVAACEDCRLRRMLVDLLQQRQDGGNRVTLWCLRAGQALKGGYPRCHLPEQCPALRAAVTMDLQETGAYPEYVFKARVVTTDGERYHVGCIAERENLGLFGVFVAVRLDEVMRLRAAAGHILERSC